MHRVKPDHIVLGDFEVGAKTLIVEGVEEAKAEIDTDEIEMKSDLRDLVHQTGRRENLQV